MQGRTLAMPIRGPATVHVSVQWLLLLAGSALFIYGMRALGLPGAWLLGPMVAGIVVGVNGGSIRLPAFGFVVAQAIVGCLVAGLMTRPVLGSFARQWPIFLCVTLSTITASSAVGWVLCRMRIFPGTTAVWGMSPGASTAMMLMAEAHGGDPRLVAFMQYLRVICVALLASLIARVWIGSSGSVQPPQDVFPTLRLVPFVETLAIAAFGIAIARYVPIPSGVLLVPMAIGMVLNASGVVEIELPRWLMAGTFAVLGWGVGLRFTRSGLVHAARCFPWILASVAVLIGFCGVVGLILHRALGTDLLTAYLATSPGGIDSAIAIGASTKVDMPFVMGLQIFRAIVVIGIGPTLARFVAQRSVIDQVET